MTTQDQSDVAQKNSTTELKTHHFDGDLRLKEVDVLGEVQRVLATVANHVRIQYVVGALEDASQVSQVWCTLQRKLEHANQHIDDLVVTHIQISRDNFRDNIQIICTRASS